jgi:hypothetical protein
MRAHATISAGLFVSALVLIGCSGDQQAITAPTAMASYASSHIKSTTFSLTCSNTGAGTDAQLTLIFSGSVQGRPPLLACGDQTAPITALKGFQYSITVTNSADTPVVICASTRTIHSSAPITCADPTGQISATLSQS